jgi:tRNA-Thr(GGU) m(6)t(6)A37 methyltransferase TsaA
MMEGKEGSGCGEDMALKAVGTIHSPYKTIDEAPFQGRFSQEDAVLEIYEEFSEALKDVEASPYLILLYWGHLADREVLQTVTPWGPEIRGVFACRSPSRPNPIEFCVVELLRRDGNRLVVRGLDAVDGSVILDIKPYSSKIDSIPEARIGWFREGDPRCRGIP